MSSPPHYKRQIWDYAKADKDEICQFLTNIDWISKFKDLSTDEMVEQFTSTVNRAVGTAAALFGLSVFLFTENPLKCFIL